MTFKELGLHEQLLEAISYMGFETATPVQEKVIPVIIGNRDLIASAQTGTGKTGAFVLPILDKLAGKKVSHTDTLIIVPTRELAVQIEQQIQGFSYFIPVDSKAVYGGGDGSDWESEGHAFRNGTNIIIATPGRLISHLKMGNVRFKYLKHLILDEADRMLDMGFIEDIKTIISHLPEHRQTLMFSATMPKAIRQLAQKILHDPVEISLANAVPAEGIDQKVYKVFPEQKDKLLKHILEQKEDFASILIFSSTKSKITDIVRFLNRNGLPSQGISSNLDQEKREEVLRDFRSRQIRILVASDVMSRGIDIMNINLVINYDVPHDPEDYVHRIGRTARVSTKGEAITFVTPKELHKLKKIEQLIKNSVPELPLPEHLGKAPHQAGGEKQQQKTTKQNTDQGKEPHRRKSWKKRKPKDHNSKNRDTHQRPVNEGRGKNPHKPGPGNN
jgi:superfamily II DNA/RNA helicase